MRVCFNCEREARVVINNLHPPFYAKGLCDAKGPCIDRWYREFASVKGARSASRRRAEAA